MSYNKAAGQFPGRESKKRNAACLPKLLQLKKPRSKSVRESSIRLQTFARRRADEQARRVPWQRLEQARNHYIDWQEFYYWVRSIFDVEDRIPDWLTEGLRDRCPGFLETKKALSARATKARPLSLRLEDWIDDHFFSDEKQEGWFNAVTYYAIRNPRYQRAQVCWSQSVEKWKKAKPNQYPSFEEWRITAAQCDDTAHLTSKERKARTSAKRAHPDRLAAAVAQYIDCEALAYWARRVLDSGSHPPEEVVRELERSCPGFLENELMSRAKQSRSSGQEWQRLMAWLVDHRFQDAKAEGWFDAILALAHNHPRAIRTMEYADHCDELWSSKTPEPYPSFQDWRKQADGYVEASAD